MPCCALTTCIKVEAKVN